MFGQAGLLQPPQAGGRDDRLEPRFGRIKIVIDQNEVIPVPMADFVPASLHPAGDRRRVILTASLKPSAQFSDGRRQKEDRQRMLAERRIADLLGPLPVDIKEHIAPLIDGVLDGATGRAVEISEDLRVFQHVPNGHLRLGSQ